VIFISPKKGDDFQTLLDLKPTAINGHVGVYGIATIHRLPMAGTALYFVSLAKTEGGYGGFMISADRIYPIKDGRSPGL